MSEPVPVVIVIEDEPKVLLLAPDRQRDKDLVHRALSGSDVAAAR